jgi:phosphatidylglycerophosphate synthase
MFDIALRSSKDQLFDPISHSVPSTFTPLRITALAFCSGLISCALTCTGSRFLALAFWLLNRGLDCLDGAVARHRKQQSELGGFLDLLGDFIVYALIPICCAYRHTSQTTTGWAVTKLLVIALLEAAFFINNFVLFYIAALVEKGTRQGMQRQTQEVTSVAMRPALIEGFESAVFFTLMLAMPHLVAPLALLMLLGVVIGTSQRVWWLATALSHSELKAS